jgi:hypothetical protein
MKRTPNCKERSIHPLTNICISELLNFYLFLPCIYSLSRNSCRNSQFLTGKDFSRSSEMQKFTYLVAHCLAPRFRQLGRIDLYRTADRGVSFQSCRCCFAPLPEDWRRFALWRREWEISPLGKREIAPTPKSGKGLSRTFR